MRKMAEWDARERTLAGIAAFVLVPGLLIGGAMAVASVAITRAIPTSSSTACTPTQVPGPIPDTFSVNVINSSAPAGAAGTVLRTLPLRHFKPGVTGNDTQMKVVKGVGELRYGPSGLDQALVVQKLLLPGATLAPDYREDTSVDLVLGPDFKTLQPSDEPLIYKSDITVDVRNPTQKFPDADAEAVKGLQALGFHLDKVQRYPDAPGWETGAASIIYGPDGEMAAQILKPAIPGATLIGPDPTVGGNRLVVTVGEQWAGVVGPDKMPLDPPKKPRAPIPVVRPCPAG